MEDDKKSLAAFFQRYPDTWYELEENYQAELGAYLELIAQQLQVEVSVAALLVAIKEHCTFDTADSELLVSGPYEDLKEVLPEEWVEISPLVIAYFGLKFLDKPDVEETLSSLYDFAV